MKKNPLTFLTTIFMLIGLVGCAGKPPETVVEKQWKVDPETGNYEEKEVRTTTIYTNQKDNLPELKLPKRENKN